MNDNNINLDDHQKILALMKDLKDPYSEARKKSAETLGKMGQVAKDSVPSLIEALWDKDVGVRRTAIIALGEIGDPRAIPELVRELDSYALPYVAEEALAKFGPDSIPAIIQLLNQKAELDGHAHAISVLGMVGDAQIVPTLITYLLQHPRRDARSAAAGALAAIRDPEAIPALIYAVTHDVEFVRMMAGPCLAQFGKEAVPALVETLETTSPFGNPYVMEALGKIGDPQAVPALEKKLLHSNQYVRMWAARALGEIGDRQSVTALVQALVDNSLNVRREAVYALGKIDDPRIRLILEERLPKEPFDGVYSEISYVLKKINSQMKKE